MRAKKMQEKYTLDMSDFLPQRLKDSKFHKGIRVSQAW